MSRSMSRRAKPCPRLAFTASAFLALAAVGLAKIEALTLDQMVARADNAVYGEIVAKRAFRVDHPLDGPGLYFTTLTLEGRSLAQGALITVDVTYHGGWVAPNDGVWNSEAPSEDDTRVGSRVVVFYDWRENLGGGVAANGLEAAHGGLYRTVDGPHGTIVLGRGPGYCVRQNVALAELEAAIAQARAEQHAADAAKRAEGER